MVLGQARFRRRQLGVTLAGFCLISTLMLNSATPAGSTATPRPTARHKGTIIATWQATLTTVDPAYTYSYVDWPQTHAIFGGLLGVDTQLHLFPDLAAAMPTVSSNGLTYTFHLRHGLVFSNGDTITAQDFIYSWERVLAAKTASPDTYLWFALAGQADFTAGKTKHIGGLAAPDATTLKVTLTEPYPGFLNVLSIPTSYVVDPAVIHAYHAENKDFGVHAVGSGPFMLQDWVAGQKMDLVRNPHYWNPALPESDAVHIDLGVDPSVALLRIEKGQADLMGDAIPAAQFASVISDPKLAPLVQHRTDVGVYMIAMNVKVKPFDNLKVRQAVAYAINKLHAVRFINGRGTVATRIIPPSMPGFGKVQPDLYPYNPSKAKQLLAAAGYPNGFSTTMGVPDSVYETRMAEAAISDLAQVGIKIAFKKVVTEGSAVATLPMQAYHWILDYPDPADFIDGFTSCSAAAPGGSNVGFYCNKTLDDMANRARGMAPTPARVAAYQKIDDMFTADASSVPVFNDVFMRSTRRGYRTSVSARVGTRSTSHNSGRLADRGLRDAMARRVRRTVALMPLPSGVPEGEGPSPERGPAAGEGGTVPAYAGYWARVWRRFRGNPPAVASAMVVLVLCLVAIFAVHIAPFDPSYQDPNGTTMLGAPLAPTPGHWLGTDADGRDALSRVIYGAQVSLLVGIVANGIAGLIGLVCGSLAGYFRGWVDILISRFIDIFLAFPVYLLALALVAVLTPSIRTVIGIVVFVFWTSTARIIRGQVLSLRERDFVEAARAVGQGEFAILLRHIYPHLIATLVVYTSLGIATTVLFEAGLSYLGVGVPHGTPSWGGMISDNQDAVTTAPWLVFGPGAAIVITVVAFNVLGDGLRDALDPHQD